MAAAVDGQHATGDEAARDVLSQWAGDRYAIYDDQAGLCLIATLEMDSATAAEIVAEALAQGRGFAVEAVGPTQRTFDTCG